MPVSIGLTACCLFIVGAILSLYTGKSAIKNGLKMLLIGSTAGATTYLIGHVIGITLT
jgi:VIT1/CCC1 family predicted Fe2+/Mn2+ transporter